MAGPCQDRRMQAADSVSILLWNVNFGSSTEVFAEELLDSMQNVLNEIKEKQIAQLMVLCTDQVTGTKSKLLKQYLCGRDRGKNNEHAEVFHTEGLSVDYLKSDEVRRLYGKRPSVTILTKGENKTLVASWHGPTKGQKGSDCLSVFKQLDCLKDKHGCRAAIVGGDFNMEPEDVRAVLNASLQYLYAEVGDRYPAPADRLNKSKLDFLVYWPKWAFIIAGTQVVADDRRKRVGKMVFDHPIVMYTMWDWSVLDLDDHFGPDTVALTKWATVKADADFTFSFSGRAAEHPQIEHHAKQILSKLNMQHLYRVEGSAIFQDSNCSSPTITPFGRTQLFLSKHYSTHDDIVDFDSKVRECGAENPSSTVCGTVYGVFRMEGSIRIAEAVTKNPGPRRKTTKRKSDVTSTTDQSQPHASCTKTTACDPNTVSQRQSAEQEKPNTNATSGPSECMPVSRQGDLDTNNSMIERPQMHSDLPVSSSALRHSTGTRQEDLSSAFHTKLIAASEQTSSSQRGSSMPPLKQAAAKRKASPGDRNLVKKSRPSAGKGGMKAARLGKAYGGLQDSEASSSSYATEITKDVSCRQQGSTFTTASQYFQPTSSGAQAVSSRPSIHSPLRPGGAPLHLPPVATPSSSSQPEEEETTASAPSRSGDIHVCPTCRITCKTKSALTEHRRLSHGYKCHVCGKGFITKGSCLTHEKSHTGVRESQQQEDSSSASGTNPAVPPEHALLSQRKTDDSSPRVFTGPKIPTSHDSGMAHSGLQDSEASSSSYTTEITKDASFQQQGSTSTTALQHFLDQPTAAGTQVVGFRPNPPLRPGGTQLDVPPVATPPSSSQPEEEETTVSAPSGSGDIHVCPTCRITCKTKSALTEHRRLSHGYKCHVCGKGFITKGSCLTHEKSHTGVRESQQQEDSSSASGTNPAAPPEHALLSQRKTDDSSPRVFTGPKIPTSHDSGMAHSGLQDSEASSSSYTTEITKDASFQQQGSTSTTALQHFLDQPTAAGTQVVGFRPNPPLRPGGTPLDVPPVATPPSSSQPEEEKTTVSAPSGSGDIHVCPTCRITCKTKSALTEHRRLSHGYKCHVCGKGFITKGSCLTHEKSHTEVRESQQQEDSSSASGTNPAAPPEHALLSHRKTDDSSPRVFTGPKIPTSHDSGMAHSGLQDSEASSSSYTTEITKDASFQQQGSTSTTALQHFLDQPTAAGTQVVGFRPNPPLRPGGTQLDVPPVATPPSSSQPEEEETTVSAPSGSGDIHVCPTCRITCKTKSALTEHRRLSHGYKCHVCGKGFITKGSCLTHEKSHTGVRESQQQEDSSSASGTNPAAPPEHALLSQRKTDDSSPRVFTGPKIPTSHDSGMAHSGLQDSEASSSSYTTEITKDASFQQQGSTSTTALQHFLDQPTAAGTQVVGFRPNPPLRPGGTPLDVPPVATPPSSSQPEEEKTTVSAPSGSGDIHVCPTCRITCKTKSALTEHRRLSHGYKCHVCGKGFITKGSCLTHEKSHTEVRESQQQEDSSSASGTNPAAPPEHALLSHRKTDDSSPRVFTGPKIPTSHDSGMAHSGLQDSEASSSSYTTEITKDASFQQQGSTSTTALQHFLDQPTAAGTQVVGFRLNPPLSPGGTQLDVPPVATPPSSSQPEEEETTVSAPSGSGNIHVCPTCRITCKTKSALTEHRRLSHGYKCRVCGKGFITKGSCLTHEKSHTGVRESQQQEDSSSASGTNSAALPEHALLSQRKTDDSSPRVFTGPKIPTSYDSGMAHSGLQDSEASSSSYTTEITKDASFQQQGSTSTTASQHFPKQPTAAGTQVVGSPPNLPFRPGGTPLDVPPGATPSSSSQPEFVHGGETTASTPAGGGLIRRCPMAACEYTYNTDSDLRDHIMLYH